MASNKSNRNLTQQTLNIFTLPSGITIPLPTSSTGLSFEDIIHQPMQHPEHRLQTLAPETPHHYPMLQDIAAPLNQTIVDGDALSINGEYSMEEL